MSHYDEFEHDLTALLNRYSMDQDSDTPDFILAKYLMRCLNAWNGAVEQRYAWYGGHEGPPLEAKRLDPR